VALACRGLSEVVDGNPGVSGAALPDLTARLTALQKEVTGLNKEQQQQALAGAGCTGSCRCTGSMLYTCHHATCKQQQDKAAGRSEGGLGLHKDGRGISRCGLLQAAAQNPPFWGTSARQL
jgi:hypothetical protein